MIEQDSGSRDLETLCAEALDDLEAGRTPDLEALCGGSSGVRRELQTFCDDWLLGKRLLAHRSGSGSGSGSSSSDASDSAWSEVLGRLASHRSPSSRYRQGGELARGGMGAIVEVWDEDLRRRLAKKLLLRGHGSSAREVDRSIGRFLEEAQVTAQLEHPGIVPVHELGVDSEGNVYFTMRLVRGRDLKSVFKDLAGGASDWTRTRALGALLRICEAMAFAHSRGVIHRDLKPSNVMVGRFGEVYVMDWGLAHVLTRDAGERQRRTAGEPDRSEILTDRTEVDAGEDSPIFTLDGDVVGTPSYMSPEQARGDMENVGPRSDVYAVGAILYQLLTGTPPYVVPGEKITGRTIWHRVLEGSPAPIEQLTRDVAPELVAICERAMVRDPSGRYADMEEMAADVAAYLEGRVVRAHRTGALPEAAKWIGRNRLAAAAFAALTLVAAGAALGLLAQERGRTAEQRFHADVNLAPALLAEVDELGPIHPDSIPELEAWEARTVDFLARMPAYRRELDALRARATGSTAPVMESPYGPTLPALDLPSQRFDVEGLEAELAESRRVAASGAEGDELEFAEKDLTVLPPVIEYYRDRLQRGERRLEAQRSYEFASPVDAARHRVLTKLTSAADEFTLPGTGALNLVRARLDQARTLLDTLEHPMWQEAVASIADVEDCPAYGGLEIAPQLGLVPLRRNPSTGLWEFLHVLSGAAPPIAAGTMRVLPESGVVLVLLPGGTARLGAEEPVQTYDWPQLEVELDPFFLSKYELTVVQYQRGTGRLAGWVSQSSYMPGGERVGPTNPVEGVSWVECGALLARWALTFPTEAQWEYAARANSNLKWSTTGDAWEAVARINAYDQDMEGRGMRDGMSEHGAVDAQDVNAFDLVGTLGNVSEWCLDWDGGDSVTPSPRDGDGLVVNLAHSMKVARGGSWLQDIDRSRVTMRWNYVPDARDWDLGVRPARLLDPLPPGESQ